MLEINLKNI